MNQKRTGLKTIKGKIKKVVDPDLKVIDLYHGDYDYILLGAGYIDRLEDQKEDIIQQTSYTPVEHDLIGFYYFDNGEKSTVQKIPDDVFSTAMNLQKAGLISFRDSVCIRSSDYGGLIDYIKSLHHAAFFSEESRPDKVASFRTRKTGAKVLYEEYDTESD